MNVRRFKHDDAERLAQIYHEAVHRVGRRYYSQAQLNAWSPRPVSEREFVERLSDGRSVFVAVDRTGRPLGFIELEPDGHIDCFYCCPSAVGTGVGTALYRRLEEFASEAGLTRLYVEASEAARQLFLSRGFAVIRRREFELNDVSIHNYLMEKRI